MKPPVKPIGGPPVRQWLMAILIAWITATSIGAGEPHRVRELYVPFEDLERVLEAAGQRVFLTRQEYAKLLEAAKQPADDPPPLSKALLSAVYEATIADNRAQLAGRILLETTVDGLQAVPLDLAHVGVRRATLDGQPAAIGIQDGQTVLFVSGRGRHELILEMVLPMEVTAARQKLQYRLPTAAAVQWRLVVPGDVEIRAGAQVLNREVDPALGVTRFELLPSPGDTTLEMTLNNRLAQQQSVVVARQVIVDELTEAYERLHAIVSMKIVHGATQRFRMALPAEFEVTRVSTPQLARWEVTPAGEQRILEVQLRSPGTGTVVIQLTAERTAPPLADWRMPQLQPLDVGGCVSAFGLLAEDRLRLKSLSPEGLIPIDTRTLTDRLPPSVLAAEPGAPAVRPLAAYYAPQTAYSLTANLERPPGRLDVTSNLLLILQDAGLELRGGFALTPNAERIFDCQFSVEPGWEVTEVTCQGTTLSFERFQLADEPERIRVQLPQGIAPGQTVSLQFHAIKTPDRWLEAWSEQELRFPSFTVVDAASERGGLAVQVRDDLTVRPEQTSGVTPLDDRNKAAFNLAEVPTTLAYCYENPPWEIRLHAERKPPRITAETYSFLKIEPGNLRANYEIFYRVLEARTRTLAFLLPEETPVELTIVGLDGTKLKSNSPGQVADGFRRWDVQLVEPADGSIHLSVSFQQRLENSSVESTNGGTELLKDYPLALIRAADVDYQSGTVAVEGSAELEVELETDIRKVDVGELVDAAYRPGQRLLGTYGFVGDPPPITASVSRPEGYHIPEAIVKRGALVTAISAEGWSQTAARFLLRTKASFVEVQLPAESVVWSVLLDDKPSKPQRVEQRLLISLPPAPEATVRDLRVVYETPVSSLGIRGTVTLDAPRLRLRNTDSSTAMEVPLADLAWLVHAPDGYRLADSRGTVFPNLSDSETRAQLAERRSAWRQIAEVATMGGPLILAARARTDAQMAQSSRAFRQSAATSEELIRERERPRQPFLAFSDPRDEAKPAPAAEMPQQVDLSDRLDAFESDQPIAGGSNLIAEGVVAGEPAAAATARGKSWALEGLRSLKIDLAPRDAPLRFQSLGSDPTLQIGLVDGRRTDLLAWSAALLVLLLGLLLLRSSASTQTRFVLGVLVVATVVPLFLGGFRPWGATFDFAIYAAVLLIPVYLVAALWRRLVAVARPMIGPHATAALLLICLVSAASGQAPSEPLAVPPTGPLAVQLVEPDPPAKVPADAILVPYDPNSPADAITAERILVPYQRYVELWNRAHPDQRLTRDVPPADYAFAGGQWRTTLVDGEYLLVEGELQFEQYVDRPVTVPLNLGGGVLQRAELDGRPARMQLIQAADSPPASETQQRAVLPAEVQELATLHMTGEGRKQLTLTVRYRLQRHGGWRTVRGQLPGCTVNALTLTVPESETELRLSGVVDRTNFETTQPQERIETALTRDGSFQLEWRPKVGQATVDRSLTVQSEAVLDVQEDGLRLAWTMQLKFPLSQRDRFTVQLPNAYVVEQVEGDNVRGWQAEDGQLEITLLKTARDAQALVLHLARRGAIGAEDLNELEAPVVGVAEAVLHEGRIVVRRSPLLELRVVDTEGLTRTDLNTTTKENPSRVESPLGIRPFQAYRFTRTPFRLGLSVVPASVQLTAEIQTLLQWSQVEQSLESRVIFHGSGRPTYAMTLAIPAQLTVESVQLVGVDRSASADAEMRGPVDCQWAVDSENGTRRLRVFLVEGQLGTFSLLIRGSLEGGAAADTMELPRIAVEQVDRQETTIVVRTDPGFDSRVDALQGCQTVLLQQTFGWLQPDQRRLARLAIRCPGADYAGQLRLERRAARVSCQTISNLAVTNRTFEETILLDFLIEDGGIGEVTFLLPAALRDARVQAPLIRQKSVEETDDPAWVRVRLELQDDMVMGEYRVLVEMDRILNADVHPIPIPRVESNVTTRRYVALETRGREEVLVGEPVGLEPLSREQRSWRPLAEMLGEDIHQAFLVQPSATDPRLTVQTKEREVVETAGARILLAETVLTLDASGAYRGVFTCHVDNRTEQFLELTLPLEARLWTAHVAGKPVKPITGSGSVRIPIVKTAEGDLDYEVVLKYGGRMNSIGRYGRVEFPLMRSREIQVEESQVRVFLPDTHKWFGFDGTMGMAAEAGDLFAGYLNYKTQQIRTAKANLTSANPYTRLRARSNLAQLGREIEQLQQLPARYSMRRSGTLQKELDLNRSEWREAQQQLGQQQQAESAASSPDNRKQLGALYFDQSTEVGRNAVNTQGANFESLESTASKGREITDKESAGVELADSAKLGQIQDEWFGEAGLGTAQDSRPGRSPRIIVTPGKPSAPVDQAGSLPEIAESEDAGEASDMATQDLFGRAKGPRGTIVRGDSVLQEDGRPESKLERFRDQLERGAGVDADSDFASPHPAVEEEPLADGVPRPPSGAPFSPDGQSIVPSGSASARQLGIAGQVPSDPTATPATGLASLDIEFPQRGTEYRFTTPGGDTNILGRAVERSLLSRSMRLLAVTLVLALVGVLFPRVQRWSVDSVLNRGVCLLLIFAGLILLLLVPWIGLAALLIGSLQFARLTWLRRAERSTPS